MVRPFGKALVAGAVAVVVACTPFGEGTNSAAGGDAGDSGSLADARAEAGACPAAVLADFAGGRMPPGLTPIAQYVGGMVTAVDVDAGQPAPSWTVTLTPTTGIRRNCLLERIEDPTRCLTTFRFSSRVARLETQRWGLSIGAIDFANGSHLLLEVAATGTAIALSEREGDEPARYLGSGDYPRNGEWFDIELRLSTDPRNPTPRFFVAGREVAIDPAIFPHDRVEAFCVGIVDGDPDVGAAIGFDNVAFR